MIISPTHPDAREPAGIGYDRPGWHLAPDVWDSEWLADLLRRGAATGQLHPPSTDSDGARTDALPRSRHSFSSGRTKPTGSTRHWKAPNLKLAMVGGGGGSDILGVSRRHMLEALLAGERDPEVLLPGSWDIACQTPRTPTGAYRTGPAPSTFRRLEQLGIRDTHPCRRVAPAPAQAVWEEPPLRTWGSLTRRRVTFLQSMRNTGALPVAPGSVEAGICCTGF